MKKGELSMAKKMISVSVESEYLLESIENYASTSAFINESILNNSFPCYSRTLRTSALYLLDVLCSADINVKGKTLTFLDEKEVRRLVDDILIQALLWLKDKTINIPSPIKTVFEQYQPSPNDDQNVSPFCESTQYLEMKNRIDSELNVSVNNPIDGAMKIIENWEHFYKEASTYEYLAAVIKNEKKNKPIAPRKVFKILRDMESIVIMQIIKN